MLISLNLDLSLPCFSFHHLLIFFKSIKLIQLETCESLLQRPTVVHLKNIYTFVTRDKTSALDHVAGGDIFKTTKMHIPGFLL